MDSLSEPIDIEGVVCQPLKQIDDPRGAILHMLRNDSALYMGFGEIYFSEIKPGVVKAWKRHLKMTQHLVVPVGLVRLVVYDDRLDSRTKGQQLEILMGRPGKYCLVRIQPMLWYGFQGIDRGTSLIANCTDIPHDPEETEGLDKNTDRIPYQWPDSKGICSH